MPGTGSAPGSRILHLCVHRQGNSGLRAFLVELKTNDGSIKTDQLIYLEKATRKTLAKVMQDVCAISDSKNSSKKYTHLIGMLINTGLLTEKGTALAGTSTKCELVFIVPSEKGGNTIRRHYENTTGTQSESAPVTILTFADIIERCDSSKDEVLRRFLRSLHSWETSV